MQNIKNMIKIIILISIFYYKFIGFGFMDFCHSSQRGHAEYPEFCAFYKYI